jgi:hypothetical protein
MLPEETLAYPSMPNAVLNPPLANAREFLVHSVDLGTLRATGLVNDLLPGTDPAPSAISVVRLPLAAGAVFAAALARLRRALNDPTGERVTPNFQLQPWVSPGGDSGPRPVAIAALDYGRARAGRVATIAVYDSGVLEDYVTYDPRAHLKAAGTVPDGNPGPGAEPTLVRHGSFVASRVSAASSTAKVKAVKVFGSTGGVDDFTLATAIDAFLKVNPDVSIVNLSCGTFSDVAPLALATVVRNHPRVLWVAAAGNLTTIGTGATTLPAWPANMPEVIGVGALDANNNKTAFTDQISADVWAPGEAVLGVVGKGMLAGVAAAFNGYATWSGTSFAAPFVAARLADFMGQFTALNPPPPGTALVRAAQEYLYGGPLPALPARPTILVT